MKNFTLLLFSMITFFSNAQTAYVQNGYPVIDLSALDNTGITTTENNRITGTPSTSAFLNGTTTAGATTPSYSGSNQISGEWNKKMSRKFQIMKSDLGNTTYTWINAYNEGKCYSGEGGAAGQWRMPTQRELLMIWSLHPQLVKLGGSVFTPLSSATFWSCSEYFASSAWGVHFGNGSSYDYYKYYTSRVRLVRDLN